MKRPNGYGSVVKFGGKRRKPYSVLITVGFHYVNGIKKQKRKFIGSYATRAEAEQRLLDLNKGLVNIDKMGTTFAEVKEEWASTHYIGKDKSTVQGYEAAFSAFEVLHHQPLEDIRKPILQEIVDGGTSYSSRSKRKSLLNQMYLYAIDEDIVSKNLAKGIKLGLKPDSNLHVPFTEEEIIELFENQHIEFVDMVLIQIHTGARTVDLTNPIKFYLEDGYMIGGSKTEAGRNRVIPLHDNIINFVAERYEQYGKLFEDKMSPDMYAYRFERVMKELEMKHLPHDCRHTFVTIMNNQGANEIAVQRIIGHSVKGVTRKVYTHKSIEDLKKVIKLFPDYKHR